MKAVIKFKTEAGGSEYFAPEQGGYSRYISDAKLYDDYEDALRVLVEVKRSELCAPIWKTAWAQTVKLVEV